jgi:hypothetical protein
MPAASGCKRTLASIGRPCRTHQHPHARPILKLRNDFQGRGLPRPKLPRLAARHPVPMTRMTTSIVSVGLWTEDTIRAILQ